ncbi:hypothetical protein BC941DRAFT_465191 [Chlamydoabsidia padenii]|nr:hypothetical protein BC941DRAFT_465191 [Chlamydoabsidia padenii]
MTSFIDTLDFIKVMESQIMKCQQSDVTSEEYLVLLLENKEKYRELCTQADFFQKQNITMKRENASLIKTQQRLETQLYVQEQELHTTRKQMTMLTRRNKDLESRLESECQNYEADRLVWYQTELDLTSTIKTVQSNHRDGVNPRRARSATASNVFNVSNEVNHHPSCIQSHSIDTLDRRQEFHLAKIQAQDRLLKCLTAEFEKQKSKHLESMQEQDEQLASITAELASVKALNHTLMEDNEGYQMLLTEKTMSGEFPKKVEQEEPMSLATEMKRLSNDSSVIQELTNENKILKESNKALSLYMNKILLKIVGNHDLVDVLNIDEDDEPLQQPRARRSTISTCRNSKDPQEKGWTKALKRMTVMGWSSSSHNNNKSVGHDPRHGVMDSHPALVE